MAEQASDDDIPFTEPLIVPCLFCTGTETEIVDGFVRVVGWVRLPVIGGVHERRIIYRVVMPIDVARGLVRDLQRELRRGGH